MPKGRTWSDDDLEFLSNNYTILNRAELSIRLNRTIPAITSKLKNLELRLSREMRIDRMRKACGNWWTPEDDKKLREIYLNHTEDQLAEIFGRTPQAIQCRKNVLGLRLPAKEKDRRLQEWLSKGRGWNKGLKGTHFSPQTEFKKGSVPHNTKHDGCIAIRKHKSGPVKYIRIAKGKWEVYRRWLWVQHYGPIPAKTIVASKDRNLPEEQIDNIENLQLMSKKENARRNKPADLYLNTRKYRSDSDKHIATLLAKGDKKFRKDIMENYPELIEMKRAEINLRKELTNAASKQTA